MTINTLDGWFAAQRQHGVINKLSVGSATYTLFSTWFVAGQPGGGAALSNTTSGELYTDSSVGALPLTSFAVGATGYLSSWSVRAGTAGAVLLYDRLWGAGGIAMTALATTTFSGQPSISGRVPGGDDYRAVSIFLEVYPAGTVASGTTVSVSYTNQSGVSGRTTALLTLPASPALYLLTELSLQSGDSGVQKVDSVTVGGVAAATGSFNVLLMRRLAMAAGKGNNWGDIQGWDILGAPEVFETSCLMYGTAGDGGNVGALGTNLVIVSG